MDVNSKAICPFAPGTKDQQPATYSPKTGLFYLPTNQVCREYEPFKVAYTAGQTYIGATLSMHPAPGSHGGMGNFIAWDAGAGKIVCSKPEKFSVWIDLAAGLDKPNDGSGAVGGFKDLVKYTELGGVLTVASLRCRRRQRRRRCVRHLLTCVPQARIRRAVAG